nr:unnamed protein product [Spirometra erinaceieuropaei]
MALVARKLVCYKMDMAALSEVRFSEQGQLEEQRRSSTAGQPSNYCRCRELRGEPRVPTDGHSLVDRLGCSRPRTSSTSGLVRRHWRRYQQPARRKEPPAQSLPQQSSLLPWSPSCAAAAEKDERLDGSQGRGFQGFTYRNEWENFFASIKDVYGPPTKGTTPLRDTDGSTLLIEKTNSTVMVINANLDLPSFLHETFGIVKRLSSGKSHRSGTIPVEIYKNGDPHLMDHLAVLFYEIWRQGQVSRDFEDATIVHLYKRKRKRRPCDNHRSISLLNIAGKIFSRISLKRLNNHLEQESEEL